MAIEFSLVLDTELPPVDVLKWMVEKHSMIPISDERNDSAQTDGMVCTAIPRSKLGRELVREAFRIESTMDIVCRMDKFEEFEKGMDNLVALASGLLSSYPCDVVMLSNGEKALLLRRKGILYIDVRDKYWEEKWTAMLAVNNMPFELSELPSL